MSLHQSINFTNNTEFQQKNLIYIFTYEDGTEIKTGDRLNVGDTKTLKLLIEYDRNIDVLGDEDKDSKELDLSASILYVQA